MKTIKRLREKLESIGASLDERADNFIVLDAPSGYLWRSNGCTSITIYYRNNAGQSWLAQAMRDEMPSLKMGLEKITSEKELAKHRWSLDDDTWGAPENAPVFIAWPK